MSDRPDEKGKGSHRLRFGAGLLVGTLLVAAVGHRLLTSSLGETARFGEDRRAVVSLRALTDVVARAGSGEAVRTVVAGFAKAQPEVAATRVVLFDGISLEASTDPADTGENAPPRRLKREEKDLYDRGQRLRAAIENYEESHGLVKERKSTTVEEVRRRLKKVMNPLVGLDLVKTELITGIMVENGKVTIAVDLPETNQFANVIRQEIVEKIEPLWDVKEVEVRFTK